MIIGLHHAQITIPNGEETKARQFYCTLLGLPEIEKPDSLKGRGGFWIQAGYRQIHIGTEDGVQRQLTKAHLAYEVSDLSVYRAKIESQGLKPLEGIPIPGYDRFECRDPFGNRVEFIQRLSI